MLDEKIVDILWTQIDLRPDMCVRAPATLNQVNLTEADTRRADEC